MALWEDGWLNEKGLESGARGFLSVLSSAIGRRSAFGMFITTSSG